MNQDLARLYVDLIVGGFILTFGLLLLLAFASWWESR